MKKHMRFFARLIVLSLIILHTTCPAHGNAYQGLGADIVVYSYDRPLQLFALLESIDTYVCGVNAVHVIYRVSDEAYETAYQEVKHIFNHVHYVRQSSDPYSDFKLLTLQAVQATECPYLLFAVDDIIVKDEIDLNECIAYLARDPQVYGFYLRLGKNTTYCYPQKKSQGVPLLEQVGDVVYAWRFGQGLCCWGYPHTLDMTVYKKQEILPYLKSLAYSSPNTLEGNWSRLWQPYSTRRGLCFEFSKVVNIPANRVQNDILNSHMRSFTPQQLLELFNAGKKIAIAPLYRVHNSSAHMEYWFEFIDRQ